MFAYAYSGGLRARLAINALVLRAEDAGDRLMAGSPRCGGPTGRRSVRSRLPGRPPRSGCSPCRRRRSPPRRRNRPCAALSDELILDERLARQVQHLGRAEVEAGRCRSGASMRFSQASWKAALLRARRRLLGVLEHCRWLSSSLKFFSPARRQLYRLDAPGEALDRRASSCRPGRHHGVVHAVAQDRRGSPWRRRCTCRRSRCRRSR